MKVTIEWEDQENKPQKEVIDGITSFGLIGCGLHKELTHFDLNRTFCPRAKDSYYSLTGKCYEMIERLRRAIDSSPQ